MIPVYCINRIKDKERKDFMLKQIDSSGGEVIFVEACEGADLDLGKALALGYQQELREKWFQPLEYNEIGCFVSHRRSLDLFLASDAKHCVVIEDDVILDPEFFGKINSIINKFSSWDLIKLETREAEPKGGVISNFEGGEIFATLSASKGTIGLLYSKEGASKIRQTMEEFIYPVDNHLGYLWRKQIVILGCFPSLVNIEEEIESNIPKRGSVTFRKGPVCFIAKQLFKFNNSVNKRLWAKKCISIVKVEEGN